MAGLSEAVIRALEREYFQRFKGSLTFEQQSVADRVRRSLTWLRRSLVLSEKDTPPRFVDLWIALNSLYGVRPYDRRGKPPPEEDDFRDFMIRLQRLDLAVAELVSLIKDSRSKELAESLVGNKYLWKEFWRGHFSACERESQNAIEELKIASQRNDPATFFTCVFNRLHMLRNQIFHGSSSSTTRRSEDALIPGIAMLEMVLPRFIHLTIQHRSGKGWPLIPYPGKDTQQHPKEKLTDSDRERNC